MNEERTKAFYRVVAALIRDEKGRILIAQRLPKAVFPLKWEFPGGKVEVGESDEEALRRELMEELGIESEVGELFAKKTHEYDNFVIDFRVYNVSITKGIPKPINAADLKWVLPQQLKNFEFPPADEHAIALLMGEK